MITLLRIIANQNYTTNLGVTSVVSPVLTTTDPPDIPQWALRVNGLWFASLITSLATASLGMLVKSWLREYLALDTEAPRERLRARPDRRDRLSGEYCRYLNLVSGAGHGHDGGRAHTSLR